MKTKAYFIFVVHDMQQMDASLLIWLFWFLQSNKRKSSRKTSSPMGRKIDFEDLIDSARTPLSPLGNKLLELQHE